MAERLNVVPPSEDPSIAEQDEMQSFSLPLDPAADRLLRDQERDPIKRAIVAGEIIERGVRRLKRKGRKKTEEFIGYMKIKDETEREEKALKNSFPLMMEVLVKVPQSVIAGAERLLIESATTPRESMRHILNDQALRIPQGKRRGLELVGVGANRHGAVV